MSGRSCLYLPTHPATYVPSHPPELPLPTARFSIIRIYGNSVHVTPDNFRNGLLDESFTPRAETYPDKLHRANRQCSQMEPEAHRLFKQGASHGSRTRTSTPVILRLSLSLSFPFVDKQADRAHHKARKSGITHGVRTESGEIKRDVRSSSLSV